MKRATLAALAVLALAGCGFPISTPSGPTYRYSWLMLHDSQREGVQVGPKFDGAGAHWSVYWWVNCQGAYQSCEKSGYILGAPLTPGSVHTFDLPECEPLVWCPTMDGRDLGVRVPLPYAPPVREVGSELTTS